jgi:hypothetical protein
MKLKEILNNENLRQKISWVTKNAMVLLLAANLIMSFMTYRKAKAASEDASWAAFTAEQAHGAAEEAARQAGEAADSAREAASEVSNLRLSLPFR